jgi:hypothetical protein
MTRSLGFLGDPTGVLAAPTVLDRDVFGLVPIHVRPGAASKQIHGPRGRADEITGPDRSAS